MQLPVPPRLAETAQQTPAGRQWLAALSPRVATLAKEWELELGAPFEDEVSCSWVAPVRRRDGSPAVFKICLPHLEAENESAALRFWNGDGAVRLLAADDAHGAMLLERCEPGTKLRGLPEPEQDVVIARMLRRLWRAVPAPHPFRSLAEMTAHWMEPVPGDDEARWPDPGLVREGHRLYAELPRSAKTAVLLATDLHAGNVLRAEREPWLAIDPKPFVGDPAYDATQHLLNCDDRMRTDGRATVARMAELLEVDAERVRLWTFARLAARSRSAEFFARWGAIARTLV
jgi:streptomycin 6-kinase